MTLVVLPRLKVVTGPHVLKAGPLGGLCLRHQLIGAELLVREHNSHVLARLGGGGDGDGDGAAGVLRLVAQALANPPAPSTPMPAAIRPNVRREMPVIGPEYP